MVSGENDLNMADIGMTDDCPVHGSQPVVRLGECGSREDPYGTSVLECGHEVACFGPGEDNIIVRTRTPRVR